MEIELIRIFVKVVQQSSFSRAAEILKVPKSTVSKAITRLEYETGAKLLLRTTRSLTLTAVGRAFYETCMGPIQTLEEAQKSLNGNESILTGLVRVTAPEDLGIEIIAPTIGELSRKHPLLNFELNYTDDIVDLIKEGFDIAIRIGKLPESSLKVKRIGEIQIIPVASPKYLKNASKIFNPKDLEKHTCLSLTNLRAQWHLKNKSQSATVKINPRIVSNQMTSLMKMALAGAGIALVPHFLCRKAIQSELLVRVLPDWNALSLPVSLLSPLGTSSSARLKLVSESIFNEIHKSISVD